MKQIKLCSILCVIVMTMNQCGNYLEVSYPFNIKNNHTTDIYYHINFSSIEKENDVIYPDTTLSFRKEILIRVTQGTVFHDNMPLRPIEEWILDLPEDTISIYIFDKDTLDRYEWDKVQKSYKVLKRYDLSSEDINLLYNKYDVPEIPYPPDERMKDMKMYPPYR